MGSSSKMKAPGNEFSTLAKQLASLLEENSDLSDSDEEQCHFIISSELAGVVEIPQQQNMSGRGRNTVRGCGRCSGKARNTDGSPASEPAAKGACSELGSHVFDYGSKGAADQMATTWEQIIIYVGT